MKNNYVSIIFSVCFLLFIIGCESDTAVESSDSQYQGSWKLEKTSGGFFGTTTWPSKEVTINYNSDGTFELFLNDTLKVAANFGITGQVDEGDEITYTDISTYDYNFGNEVVYASIVSEQLVIWDGMMDGYFSYYNKVK